MRHHQRHRLLSVPDLPASCQRSVALSSVIYQGIRAIGDFILASDKGRLRPSDLTAGVRRLRSQPANKIAEWLSRFCALGWLLPEDEKAAVPKAWLVDPGLRTFFAARRQHAQAARAAAHEILKAGGTGR